MTLSGLAAFVARQRPHLDRSDPNAAVCLLQPQGAPFATSPPRSPWQPVRFTDARRPRNRRTLDGRSTREPRIEMIEVEKDDGRRVQCQRLHDDEPADDRKTERLADLCPSACAKHQRNARQTARNFLAAIHLAAAMIWLN